MCVCCAYIDICCREMCTRDASKSVEFHWVYHRRGLVSMSVCSLPLAMTNEIWYTLMLAAILGTRAWKKKTKHTLFCVFGSYATMY